MLAVLWGSVNEAEPLWQAFLRWMMKEIEPGAYSDDVDGRFQRGVNGHSGHVNKVGAQRRWDYNHARHLRD
jgi:hypothetical protein